MMILTIWNQEKNQYFRCCKTSIFKEKSRSLPLVMGETWLYRKATLAFSKELHFPKPPWPFPRLLGLFQCFLAFSKAFWPFPSPKLPWPFPKLSIFQCFWTFCHAFSKALEGVIFVNPKRLFQASCHQEVEENAVLGTKLGADLGWRYTKADGVSHLAHMSHKIFPSEAPPSPGVHIFTIEK